MYIHTYVYVQMCMNMCCGAHLTRILIHILIISSVWCHLVAVACCLPVGESIRTCVVLRICGIYQSLWAYIAIYEFLLGFMTRQMFSLAV